MRISDFAIQQFSVNQPTQRMMLDSLWVYINGLVIQAKNAAGLDENAHGKISMWIALGDLPAWRVERLAALNAWSDAAWMTYYAIKAQVISGEDAVLPESLTPCPYSFTDLLFEEL